MVEAGEWGARESERQPAPGLDLFHLSGGRPLTPGLAQVCLSMEKESPLKAAFCSSGVALWGRF